MIGDDVSVTILGVKGNQVRIGVHAPSDVEIHREEIYERVRRDRGGQAESDLAARAVSGADKSAETGKDTGKETVAEAGKQRQYA